MDIDTKRIEKTHILLNSTFQMMAGIVYGFGIYTLLERGYSSSIAGLLFSFVNLFSLVLTPIISNYLDNTEKITIFDIVISFTILVAILYGVNYFLNTKCLLLSIIFVLANGLYVTLDPMINSISSKLNTYGIAVPYSTARAAGSISYGAICALFGYISSKTSYLSVIAGGVMFSLLVIVIGMILNRQFHQVKNNKIVIQEKDDQISFKEFILNNISFLILCFFLVGTFIGFSCVDNFMLLVTENVGGTSKDMGYLLAYKAFLEGLAILAFPYILKKIKLEVILCIAVLGFAFKQLLITMAPNVFWLYVAQTFQMVSFSLINPGMVAFVNKYLKKREIIRGISMFSLTMGIGSTISSILAGYISDYYGVFTMNLWSLIISIVSAIGFIIVLWYKNKQKITNII